MTGRTPALPSASPLLVAYALAEIVPGDGTVVSAVRGTPAGCHCATGADRLRSVAM